MRVDMCLNPKAFAKEEVLAKLPQVRRALQRHEVQLAYLFGSMAMDRAGPLSDIDIAVLLDPSTYRWLDAYCDIHSDLCHVFGADNIDLVMLNEAPPPIRFAAIRDGMLIYAIDEPTRVRFVEEAIFEYHDTKPLRDEHRHYLYRQIKLGILKEFNMIEREKVDRFLALMKDDVLELKGLGLASMSFEEYLDDKRLRALSEHYLRIAIEAAIDVGRHIIAAKGLRAPEEYKKIGVILRQEGIIPPDLGEKLVAMAGLRNILVHLYWEIDYRELYRIITAELSDLERYAQCILEYVERETAK